MDLTFKTENGIFNYRVCAVITYDNKLLAMKNDLAPYYYLPGGRVKLHESADEALRRELREELGIDADIIRPLWFVQGFFLEDKVREKFHELCLYYLVDVSKTELIRKPRFAGLATKHHEIFEWLDTATLPEQYLYPLFIKDRINRLPAQFEMLKAEEYDRGRKIKVSLAQK